MASNQKIGSSNPGVMVVDASPNCIVINYLSASTIILNGSAQLQNFTFMPAVAPFLVGQKWTLYNNTVNQANFCDYYGNIIGSVQGGRSGTVILVAYENPGVRKNWWFESHDALSDQTLIWNIPVSNKINQTLKMTADKPRNVIIYANGDDNQPVSTLNYDVYLLLPPPESISVGTVYNVQYVFGVGRSGVNTHLYVKASNGSDISNFTVVANLAVNSVNNVTCTCILPYDNGAASWVANSGFDAATPSSDLEALWDILQVVGVLIPGGQIYDAVEQVGSGLKLLLQMSNYVREISAPTLMYSTFRGSTNAITDAITNATAQDVIRLQAAAQVRALQDAAISNLNPSEATSLVDLNPTEPLYAMRSFANSTASIVTNAGAKWGENFTTI